MIKSNHSELFVMKKIYLLLIISSFFGLLSNAQEMKMISTVSTNLVVENKGLQPIKEYVNGSKTFEQARNTLVEMYRVR